MYHLHDEIQIAASPEEVFRVITDHESFLGGIGGSVCRLVRNGAPDRNGLGAVREINADGMRFSEEITSFDAPRSYTYRITQLVGKNGKPFPFEHEGGELLFQPIAGGTKVIWDTSFRVRIPIVGWIVERIFGRKLRPVFRQMLERAKSRAEADAASVSN